MQYCGDEKASLGVNPKTCSTQSSTLKSALSLLATELGVETQLGFNSVSLRIETQ